MAPIVMHQLAFSLIQGKKNQYGFGGDEGIVNNKILACSASAPPSRLQVQLLSSKDVDRSLCKYRKGFFEHLMPKTLMTSTLRVTSQQGTLVFANFLTAKLEKELQWNDLVSQGLVSQEEADDQMDDWEKKAWDTCWKSFGGKVVTALLKFHAVTFVMRAYEYMAAEHYDRVVLDTLTLDIFYESKLLVKNNKDASNLQIGIEMFRQSMWANLIAFLADYSVHQVILIYGYYVYIKKRRKMDDANQKDDWLLYISCLKKSTRLVISRAIGLFSSSLGSAIGTVIWPGWGTLLFSNMGEGAAGVVLDDSTAPKH